MPPHSATLHNMGHGATVSCSHTAGCCRYFDTTHMFCVRDNTQHTSHQCILNPSLCHVCLPVVFQLVLDAFVVGTVQQTSVGGRHTCTSSIADEQLQHIGVAWEGGGGGGHIVPTASCEWLCAYILPVAKGMQCGVRCLWCQDAIRSHCSPLSEWQCAYRASHQLCCINSTQYTHT